MSAPAAPTVSPLDALQFVQGLLKRWSETGKLRPEQFRALTAAVDERRAQWQRALADYQSLPADVALPVLESGGDPAIGRTIWFYEIAADEIRRWRDTRQLSLHQSDALLAEIQERIAYLRRKNSVTGLYVVREVSLAPPEASAAAPLAFDQERKPVEPPKPSAPSRSLLEILLDPRSIQWLLGFGGALMVVGLVILLWVNEFFTPAVTAGALGLGNAALLAGGWAVIRKTRYQTAGKALTLLACLVMPLNLWYYNANDLVTLSGHLWVAGLIICAVYAASALVLRDEMFVYIFAAGVTLTGMLFLADLPPSPRKFWELAYPATLLVVLGLLAIHSERAFPDQPGPFGRKRFGLAFFWSGHVQMLSGLLLLLGACIVGDWLYVPFFQPVFELFGARPSPVVNELRWLTLALVVAGTYAYVYSDLVVRRIGLYLYIAAGTTLWAGVLLLEQLQLHLGVEAIIALLAAASLAVNLIRAAPATAAPVTRNLTVLGLVLALVPVVVGVGVCFQSLGGIFTTVWAARPPGWAFVGAMLLTAIACRVGAQIYLNKQPGLAATYFFATAAATLGGAAALLAALGLQTWQTQVPLLMLLPIIYLVAAHFYHGYAAERPLVWVGHTATGVMLGLSLVVVCQGFSVVEGKTLNLALAGFFAEAALFYGLAVALRRQAAGVYLGTAMACGSVWQLLAYLTVPGEYYTLTFAVVGLGLLVVYRFAVLEKFAGGRVERAAFEAANTLLSLSLVGACLMGLSRLAVGNIQWPFVVLTFTLAVMSLAAAGFVQQAAWRRWYLAAAIGEALLAFLTVGVLATISPAQKVEIFAVTVGLVMLGVGHVGWYRERERQSDTVSFCLLVGSLAAGVPLAIAAIVDRYLGNFQGAYVLNEFGFLAVSLLLLLTGFLFQLRATTLVGVALTVLYFLTLLIFVPWNRLNAVATAVTIGGGLIFGTGLVLSVYRERLLALPERIKRREGVFRVLGWR